MKTLAAALVCGVTRAAQAPPLFRLTVDAVRVDALVLDGDRPVADLNARNFEPLETARRTDAVIYTVGIRKSRPDSSVGFRLDVSSGIQRDPPDSAPVPLMERILPALAHETGGKYIDAERTGRLREVFTRILREFRTRYVITYTPQGVDATGWHPIEVKLKGARGKVTARRGYLR